MRSLKFEIQSVYVATIVVATSCHLCQLTWQFSSLPQSFLALRRNILNLGCNFEIAGSVGVVEGGQSS